MDDAAKHPVGTVALAFCSCNTSLWATIAIARTRFPRLCAMIETAGLRAVSLTTIKGGDAGVIPVELTLCNFPARPKSNIVYTCDTLTAAVSYKQKLINAPTTLHTMEAVPTPTNPFHSALANLDPEARAVVEARFTEIVNKLELQEASRQKLEQDVESMTQAAEADKALLKHQIDEFLGNVGDTYKSYNLGNAGERLLNSSNVADMRRAMDSMLVVANRAFLDLRTSSTTPQVQKRIRVEEPAEAPMEVATPLAEPAKEPAPIADPLARAFAATFN